jgi:hypothetical protein
LKNIQFLLLGLLLFLTGCPAEVITPQDGSVLDASTDTDMDAGTDVQIKEAGDSGYDFNLWPPAAGPLSYNGGPVMTNSAQIYLLWYSGWNNNTTVPIVEDFIIGLNSSPYFSITATYYELLSVNALSKPVQVPKGYAYATDVLIFTKSVFVGYSHGTTLTDDDVFTVISDAIDNQQIPPDRDAIYLVLTSSDVREGSGFGGFCASYCGFHSHTVYNSADLKWGFIGDPAPCLDSCTSKTKYDEYGFTHSPNFNWAADGMVSVIGHELSEAITDPDWDTAPAWVDHNGQENADRCAWNYGDLFTTDNSSVANVHLGNRDYLIQRNWTLFPDGGQGCGMHP